MDRPAPPPRPDAPPRAGRRGGVLIGLSLLVGTGCGGRANKRYELIEAELRTRTRELEEARADRDQLLLLHQIHERQAVTAGRPHPVLTGGAPANVPTVPLQKIDLGSGTGGVDEDNCPGDESLMAVIVLRDGDGTAVKVPGRATVWAQEVTPEGLKLPLGQWDVPAEMVRRAWRNGLLQSGYFIPLQWDRSPASNRLRITARFTTLDGRNFEADKDVTVRPLAGATPAPAVVPPPVAVPPAKPTEPPATIPELPAKRGGREELPMPAVKMGAVKAGK